MATNSSVIPDLATSGGQPREFRESPEELEYLWRDAQWSPPTEFLLPLREGNASEEEMGELESANHEAAASVDGHTDEEIKRDDRLSIEAVHCEIGKLRRHRMGVDVYRYALKGAFFLGWQTELK